MRGNGAIGSGYWGAAIPPEDDDMLVVTFSGPVGEAGNQWANMPAADTAVFNHAILSSVAVDLTDMTEARLSVGVFAVGTATAVLVLQHLIGAVRTDITDPLSVGIGGLRVSDWVPISLTDEVLVVGGRGGNGVVDPRFGVIAAQFRKGE